jgi:hypothetical protein
LIKSLDFTDRATGDKRLIAQQTDRLGVTLPLAPGAYDVICTTVDGQKVEVMTNVAVKAGAINRLDPMSQVAAITVYAPNVRGLDMKAVYALKAGTNQIASKVEAFETPMLVAADTSYDIALEQWAGLTRIRSAVAPKRGDVLEIK